MLVYDKSAGDVLSCEPQTQRSSEPPRPSSKNLNFALCITHSIIFFDISSADTEL